MSYLRLRFQMTILHCVVQYHLFALAPENALDLEDKLTNCKNA
jgi:hypothetical protein